MAVIDELVKSDNRYAASFRGGDLPAAPRRRVAVVTCMDARLLPSRFFGLKEGDAHVISNAGGSAREALRSLVISQLLGTREVAIVKHTDCRMLAVTDQDLYNNVRQHLGAAVGRSTSYLFARCKRRFAMSSVSLTPRPSSARAPW
jgi:carbonic anhydrase